MHYNFILLPLLTFASVSLARPVESAPDASILERRKHTVPVLNGATGNTVTIKIPFKGNTEAVWKVFLKYLMEAEGLQGNPDVKKASAVTGYNWKFTFHKDTTLDSNKEHQSFIRVANIAAGLPPGAAIEEPEPWFSWLKKNKNTAPGATQGSNAPPPAYAQSGSTSSSQPQQQGSNDEDD